MKTGKNENHVLLFPMLFIGAMLLLSAQGAWAQEPTQPTVEVREDFSDKELKLFIKANEKVTAIQAETEEKMTKVIEDEGLTVERFNEILEMQRDPAKRTETPPEELTSFNNAAQVIIKENQKIEQQMAVSIEKEGINLDTYKEIMVAYQQSPKVQSRVNELANAQEQD